MHNLIRSFQSPPNSKRGRWGSTVLVVFKVAHKPEVKLIGKGKINSIILSGSFKIKIII